MRKQLDENAINDALKKEKLKKILKDLKKVEQQGKLNEIKSEFKEILKEVDPLVIAQVEQELVNEGLSVEELSNVCDIHMELFKDQIENPDLKVPDDHPIASFQNDHKVILKYMNELVDVIKIASKKTSYNEASDELKKIEDILKILLEAENHNVRQENTLFPILERHGVEQPPAIMWMEHTEMKKLKKRMLKMIQEKKEEWGIFTKLLYGDAISLVEQFGFHTQKEQNILYSIALDVITEEEWKDIKEECDNLGYFEDNIGSYI